MEGFNIGWNCGEAAGQTVFHAHVHLIPEEQGDVEKSAGGVRHIIDGKGELRADGRPLEYDSGKTVTRRYRSCPACFKQMF